MLKNSNLIIKINGNAISYKMPLNLSLNAFFIKIMLMCLATCFMFKTGSAKKQTDYGRIYNVQDYIDSAPSGLSLTKETIGFRRCFTTVMEKIYKYCETSDTDKVFTILVPLNTGISNTIVPYNINDKLVAVRINGSNDWFRPDTNYQTKITINIIGLSINDSTLKSKMTHYLDSNQTQLSSNYSNNMSLQTFYLSTQTPNFKINGIESNASFNSYLNSVLVDINMVHSTNPADTNFLSYNTGTIMPILQSTNPDAHNFIYLRTSGQNDTDAYIFPPDSKNPNDLPNTEINICGLKLEGINQPNNSAEYVDSSQQHNFHFTMGTGLYIENFKRVFVDNMILENFYGNGISIYNRFYAYINDSVCVNKNVIKNVWGLKFKVLCDSSKLSYDDTGDGIRFEGIDSGISSMNYIKNDLSYTKQFGRIGLATCSEHNRNTIAEYNYVHGYDRGLHSENNLSGFKIRYNRFTGSETGIVFDGNRDYKSIYFCPKANSSEVSFNYISNEGIDFNLQLQKIYPAQLFFASPIHVTNEYWGTEIKNNEFLIDKSQVHHKYPASFSIISNNCNFPAIFDTTYDPRPYIKTIPFNTGNKYHIFSGIRYQKIVCNLFNTINSNDSIKKIGGIYISSFCANSILPAYQGCETYLYPSTNTPICNLTNSDTLNNTIPVKLQNNIFNECEIIHFIHVISSKDSNYIHPNVISNVNSSINFQTYTNAGLTDFTQGAISSCSSLYNTPLLFSNVVITQNSCSVSNNNLGNVVVTTIGGNGLVTYTINPSIGVIQSPANSGNFSNLTTNTYTITATDAMNNTITTTVVINNPLPLNISNLTFTNVSCQGGSDGNIVLSASGGSTPHSYTILPNTGSQITPGNFSALNAQTYTITASDANNCSISTTITITEPTAVVLTASSTDALCNGANGSLSFSATGGTANITYTVNTNQQSSPFAAPAGTYTVVATDANICSTNTILTITEPTAVVLSASATDALCNGANGSLSFSATGGTANITYTVNTNQQTSPFAAPVGTYTVVASDINTCSTSTILTITEPTAVVLTASATNALCNGVNGSLNFSATGGTSTIGILVNGISQTSPFAAPAGTYTVVATDFNGCASTTILTITEPTAVVLSASATDALCNGANGSLNFSAVGGTGTIGYTVNGTPQTSPFAAPAGTYTVVATDANLCSTNTILTITEPTAVVLTASATNALCNGANGSLNFSATGGTSTIGILVNGISQTSPFAAPAGTYTVVATDFNQCSISSVLIISEPPVLNWGNISITNINCNNPNSGGIQVQAIGGTNPYSYSISPNASPSSPGNYGSLSAGNYTVTSTDVNGCSISTVIIDLIDPNSGDFCCSPSTVVLPDIILKISPLASDLIAQFGNVITGRTFYIDGIFTINDNINFDACTFWFTPQAQIQVQGTSQLLLNNCSLDAACNWWVGIEAIQAQNKVNIQGGEINNGVWSIYIANNAELVIDGTAFTGFGYGAITFNDITDPLYAAQVTGCTFTSTGNQTAAMNTQHIGIQARNVRHLVIGDPNSTSNGNTFNGMRCGIHILGFSNINNVLGSNDNQIELYNNTFENIGFSPNQSNYSLYMNSIYTQPKGAGVYIDYSQAPSFSANTTVEYTGSLTSSTPTFNNCYKAIVSLNNNLTAKKQYIKDADFGIMNFNLMSKEVVIENNKIENAHIGTQLSGNYKYYNVFKNEIVTNAGVGISNAGFGIMAMMYPAIGVDIKQTNQPFNPAELHIIDENIIRLPYYAGKGIANLGANQSQKIKNNTILFTVPQGTAYPPVAYQDPGLYGIYNTNSKDFTLSNNLVDCQYTQGVYNSTYSKAYYFETCKEMIISCNKGRATKQGLYAWGDNSTDKTKIKSNKFKFNLNPLYTLDNGSAQPGTFGNIGNGIADNNNFWLYNMPNGNGWLQSNIYKVWRNSNVLPQHNIITSSSLLLTTESGSPGGNQYAYGVQNPPGMQPSDADCTAPDFGNSNPPISVITVNNADDIALNVAAQNEIYINYAQVGAWMNHLWLFERLRDNDSLRMSSPVLQAFYNNYQNGTIGKISNTELALASLFNFSGTNQDFIFEYNNTINANNNILSLDDHENNMRFINSLTMKILRWGIDSLTAGEKLDIEVLANLCPFVGGSAVYKARVYNSLLNPLAQYYDRLVCIQGQNKNNVNGFENLDSLYEAQTNLEAENSIQLSTHKALTTTTKFERIPADKFEDIILYPNPANTFVYFSGVTENAVFELIDVLGKTIICNNLTANIERQKIELPCLSNGIYAYKISFEKDIFCGMLNVIQDEK